MINNVLDKVKGLLSKTVEAGATQEEAASAANVAQQLITKYRLEIAELDSDDDEISEHKLPLFAGQRIINWRSDLAYWICEFNGCRPIYRKHKDQVVLTIIGRPGDVAIVRYLFDTIGDQIEQFSKQALIRDEGSGKRFTNSFKHGAVSRVVQRMRQAHKSTLAQAEADSRTTAIVRLNLRDEQVGDWLKDNVKLKDRAQQKAPSFDFTGYHKGMEAGSKVAITKGLKHT